MGHRAPLPRRVLASVVQRHVIARLPRARHRAHPPRIRHLQPAPAGEPPGQSRRARQRCSTTSRTGGSSSARAAAPGATRSSASSTVRASPTRVEPRARSGKTSSPSSPRCSCRTTYEGYEGTFWSLAAAQDPPPPLQEAAPAHVVRRRQHVSSYAMVRCARVSVCWGSRSAISTTWSRSSSRTSPRSPTPNPSVPTSTTTSW